MTTTDPTAAQGRFTDRLRHVATLAIIESMKRARRDREPFGCLLCGHVFIVGDGYRWIYCNDGLSPWKGGNFFVCDNCDHGDGECQERAAEINASINSLMKARMYDESTDTGIFFRAGEGWI